MTRTRAGIVGLVAACVLAAGVGSAWARNIDLNGAALTRTYTPLRFIAGANTVSCNVTLQLSFHSASFHKTVGALLGHVYRMNVSSCSGGSATVLAETLPWHARYAAFLGILPDIIAIKKSIVGMSLKLQPSGSVACLARSTATNPWVENLNVGAAGEIRTVTSEERNPIPLEGFLCEFAGEVAIGGTGTVTRTETGRADINVLLI